MPEPTGQLAGEQRRVALVCGVDPAATATVAATLEALGMGAPPRRWVADLHAELLGRCHVEALDARPAAWFETGKISANGMPRARLTEWLGARFVDVEGEPVRELVVSDPGLAWLLGLWAAAVLRCDAAVAHLTVVSPATEVATDGAGVAGWLNLALHTERATRGSARAFVRWADVTADWTIPFVALGEALPLRSVQEATANQIRKGHSVVAAGPPPVGTTWDQLRVPVRLRELAEETWSVLGSLADPGGDTAERQATLDELRAAYGTAYDEAESVAASSIRAARLDGRDEAVTIGDPGADAEAGTVRRGLRKALGR